MNHFNQTMRLLLAAVFTAVVMTVASSVCYSYTVSDLTASCHDGQVFLTWTNPAANNLQYNIYRSTSKFTSSSQLNTNKFLGFVRDNSSKNLQFSIGGQNIYYKIEDDAQPLSPTTGLYVVTCTSNQPYYYAVTVTDLAGNIEAKTIVPGENSLSQSVAETVAKPQPVFQDSIVLPGEVKYEYVQFVNNQETSLYPAMNSTGSFGFNIYISKRGSAVNYPLVAVYEGKNSLQSSGVGLDASITDCYVIGLYDWLPLPGPNSSYGIGDNTYFCCYHEKFNIYTDENPIPVSGTVKTYTAKRCIEAIRWAKSHFPIDPTRVYTKGVSATGFGALLTGMLYPDEIAAIYATVEPMFVKPASGSKGEIYREMWGSSATDLNSDVPDPETQLALPVYRVLDNRKMLDINENTGVPLIFDVHGKKDKTVAWSTWIINWFDSLESNHAGGVHYWDGRSHDGSGKDFLPEETTPDFFRYQTTKSFPAFSHCSINQNPGNGSPTNGDPYGAFNGYLDWDNNITDQECNYTVNVFVKDLYVGGILDPNQFNTCIADISFRRLQHFQPNTGATIKWKNFDDSNTKIQSGSFTYTGGLITLEGITVNKSGNRIELKITNCQRTEDEDSETASPIFKRSSNGYEVSVDMNKNEIIDVNLYDLLGRIVTHRKISLSSGTNNFEITSNETGILFLELKGTSFSYSGKLLF